jgi:ABC-type spermidine/putrescine transport system permease subunit I
MRPGAPAWRAFWPVLPLLAFLALVVVGPIARVLLWGLAPSMAPTAPTIETGSPWRELVATPLYREALLRTFRLSVTVTLACLVLGYPVAYVLARARGWRGQLLLALVVAPFWISVLARSFTWMVLLQRQGVVNRLLLGLGLVAEPVPLVYNEVGVHVGMVHVLLPYMILSLYGAMRAIDPALLRAAAGLGATEWQAFRRVWWPLSRPGVAAGSLLLFVVALGFFVTPALLGGGKVTTLAMLIEAHVSQAQDWPLAAALGLVLLVATLLALVPAQRALRLETLVGAGGR